MRRIWIIGAALLAGCVAQVSNSPPPPVATTAQPVVLVPVEQPSQHPHGGPPGHDPNFVPPGHGGVPPGQAKKASAIDAVGAPPPGLAAANAEDNANDEAKPKEKEKKKVQGKAKKVK